MICWTIRSDVAEGTEELESEILVRGLGLATEGPKVDILKEMLDTLKQSKVSEAVNVDVPSGMEASALKLQELRALGFTLFTIA